MGKGDRKSRRGKLRAGTYGKKRPRPSKKRRIRARSEKPSDR